MTEDLKDWLVVVPARIDSQRLPRKPLQLLGGKPLIQRVVENLAPLCHAGATLCVAVDSDDVAHVCERARVPWMMTRKDHPSGSDRCAEVAKASASPFVLNVQGDEPFIDTDDLKNLCCEFRASKAAIGTLAAKVSAVEISGNPNVVKLVKNSSGRAIYFSRAGIPYDRDSALAKSSAGFMDQHIGVYAYSQQSLADFCALPASSLEHIEKLEQLRAIEAGWHIHVTRAKAVTHGIDTPEDLVRAAKILSERGHG